MDTHATTSAPEQLKAVLRESDALAAAFKQARQVRLILFLVLVAFVVAVGLIAVGKVNAFKDPKNLNAVADTALKRMEERKEYFRKQLETLADKITPPLQDAFTKQAQKDMPLYLKALEKERDPFLANIEKNFKASVSRRFEKLRPRYEAILVKEFPDTKVRERMLANMDAALDRVLVKHLVEPLKNELAELAGMWDAFPWADAAKQGEPPIEQQFQASLLDLLGYRLTHSTTSPF